MDWSKARPLARTRARLSAKLSPESCSLNLPNKSNSGNGVKVESDNCSGKSPSPLKLKIPLILIPKLESDAKLEKNNSSESSALLCNSKLEKNLKKDSREGDSSLRTECVLETTSGNSPDKDTNDKMGEGLSSVSKDMENNNFEITSGIRQTRSSSISLKNATPTRPSRKRSISTDVASISVDGVKVEEGLTSAFKDIENHFEINSGMRQTRSSSISLKNATPTRPSRKRSISTDITSMSVDGVKVEEGLISASKDIENNFEIKTRSSSLSSKYATPTRPLRKRSVSAYVASPSSDGIKMASFASSQSLSSKVLLEGDSDNTYKLRRSSRINRLIDNLSNASIASSSTEKVCSLSQTPNLSTECDETKSDLLETGSSLLQSSNFSVDNEGDDTSCDVDKSSKPRRSASRTRKCNLGGTKLENDKMKTGCRMVANDDRDAPSDDVDKTPKTVCSQGRIQQSSASLGDSSDNENKGKSYSSVDKTPITRRSLRLTNLSEKNEDKRSLDQGTEKTPRKRVLSEISDNNSSALSTIKDKHTPEKYAITPRTLRSTSRTPNCNVDELILANDPIKTRRSSSQSSHLSDNEENSHDIKHHLESSVRRGSERKKRIDTPTKPNSSKKRSILLEKSEISDSISGSLNVTDTSTFLDDNLSACKRKLIDNLNAPKISSLETIVKDSNLPKLDECPNLSSNTKDDSSFCNQNISDSFKPQKRFSLETIVEDPNLQNFDAESQEHLDTNAKNDLSSPSKKVFNIFKVQKRPSLQTIVENESSPIGDPESCDSAAPSLIISTSLFGNCERIELLDQVEKKVGISDCDKKNQVENKVDCNEADFSDQLKSKDDSKQIFSVVTCSNSDKNTNGNCVEELLNALSKNEECCNFESNTPVSDTNNDGKSAEVKKNKGCDDTVSAIENMPLESRDDELESLIIKNEQRESCNGELDPEINNTQRRSCDGKSVIENKRGEISKCNGEPKSKMNNQRCEDELESGIESQGLDFRDEKSEEEIESPRRPSRNNESNSEMENLRWKMREADIVENAVHSTQSLFEAASRIDSHENSDSDSTESELDVIINKSVTLKKSDLNEDSDTEKYGRSLLDVVSKNENNANSSGEKLQKRRKSEKLCSGNGETKISKIDATAVIPKKRRRKRKRQAYNGISEYQIGGTKFSAVDVKHIGKPPAKKLSYKEMRWNRSQIRREPACKAFEYQKKQNNLASQSANASQYRSSSPGSSKNSWTYNHHSSMS